MTVSWYKVEYGKWLHCSREIDSHDWFSLETSDSLNLPHVFKQKDCMITK